MGMNSILSYFGVSKNADEMLDALGYEWLAFGNKGCAYEKYLGHTGPYGEPEFKTIRFEQQDDGNYIFICCKKTGKLGEEHLSQWMTYDEFKACFKKLKELRRRRIRRKC